MKQSTLSFLCLLTLLIAIVAKADFVNYPAGCYVCAAHDSLVGYYEDCSDSNGDGMYCREMQTSLVRYCQTGGGGGTGTGGSSCVTTPTARSSRRADGADCPVDCFSCGRELY